MTKNDDIEEVMKKAQTLIEALPYIQKFNGKKIVVKYGGSAMLDENLKFNVIRDVALLKLVGFKPIIVHGGGKEISKWIEKLGMEKIFTPSADFSPMTDERIKADGIIHKAHIEVDRKGTKAAAVSAMFVFVGCVSVRASN